MRMGRTPVAAKEKFGLDPIEQKSGRKWARFAVARPPAMEAAEERSCQVRIIA
jgi:hypothetical protein